MPFSQTNQVTKDHRVKPQAVRRSARLKAIRSRKQSIPKSNFVQEIQILASPLHTSNVSVDEKSPLVLRKPSKPHQKRKRRRKGGNFSQDRDRPPSKRPQTSPSSCSAEERAANDNSDISTDPLTFWSCTGRWPKSYFEQDSQVREDFERGKSPEEFEKMPRLKQPSRAMHLSSHPYADCAPRKRGSPPTCKTSTDLQRSAKSAPYAAIGYENTLEEMGSYMCPFKDGCKQEHLKELLSSEQAVPQDSPFRDDRFSQTCKEIQNWNEARIVRHITELIVPTVFNLKTPGTNYLDHLCEYANEGWSSAIPFYGPRPQPDYSIGFRKSAFTQQQFEKLAPFVGNAANDSTITNLFMATTEMYFPFLTCEVKRGAVDLHHADRQNTHSMTIAVRGVVRLYRLVGREKELDREILAFSVSHNASTVSIYGHYAIIQGDKITFYRHTIRKFCFDNENGKKKWTAYKFIRNVYDIWMPIHLKRICSAIDDLPSGVSFDLSQAASFPPSEPPSSNPTELRKSVRIQEKQPGRRT